jgi:hypothetical protein
MSIISRYGTDAIVRYSLPYIDKIEPVFYQPIIIKSKKRAIKAEYLHKQDIRELLSTNQNIRRIIPRPYVEKTIASDFYTDLISEISEDDKKQIAINEARTCGLPTETKNFGEVRFEIRLELDQGLGYSVVYCYRYKGHNGRAILCQITSKTAKFRLFISDDNSKMELTYESYDFYELVRSIQKYFATQAIVVNLT